MDKEPGKTAITPEPTLNPESTAQPESSANSGTAPGNTDSVKPAQIEPTTIAPTKIHFSANHLSSDTAEQIAWWQRNRVQMVGLGALVVILCAVIFLLPSAVKPPPPPQTQTAPALPGKPIESPWQEAQLAKQRRAAQEILAEMLKKQSILENMSVQQWAADTFANAMQTAATGDEHYRQRKFQQAQLQYRASLTLFEQLIEQSEKVYTDALSAGEQAIKDGVSAQAGKQFQLALAVRPQSSAAQQGLERANVLDQILTFIKKGQALEKQNQLAQAKQQYELALQLNGESERAKERLNSVKQHIVDRDFSQAMSAGYAALQSQSYPAAKKAFRRAAALKPTATETSRALAQAENQYTQKNIQQLLQHARQQEAKENWAAAQEDYNKALNLDKSLVAARIGEIRSGTRAKLDQQIEVALKDPIRLASEKVYRQSQALQRDAQAIANPGPRLRNQIQRLEKLLILAATPVSIQLQSDNQTDVTLYKVGKLGNFLQREMSVKPGRYTAVGSRKGYRDVRQEFSVAPGGNPPVIVIRCVEKISLDG